MIVLKCVFNPANSTLFFKYRKIYNRLSLNTTSMKIKLLIILLVAVIMSLSSASAEILYCENCSDCNEKIQNASSIDTVVLTSDIVDCDGTCINFNSSDGITFDGGGHTISGTRGIQEYGIYLPAWSCTNTVMNCTITDFWDGIYIFNSPYNFVYNVTSYNNRDSGLSILYSTGCTVGDCVLQENAGEDFYFRPYYRTDCQGVVTNVTGSGDRPIGFYTEPVDISDMEFSALYLCDAGAATFDNVSVIGSDTFDNNAIRMYWTSQAELSNITVHDNFMGLYMYECYDCVVRDSSFHDSHHYNIQMSHSDMNIIENVVSNGSSQAGIYLGDSAGNHIINATVGSNARGIVLYDGFNTLVKDSHIVDNGAHGICVGSSGNHLIYNNYFSNCVNVDLAGTFYANSWNTSITTGTNIIGESLIGGNYWSDHIGADVNGDGFIDTPYTIEGSSLNVDYLPLTEVGDPIDPVMYIRNSRDDLVVGDVWEYLVTCEDETGTTCDCGELVWESDNTTVAMMEGANITCLSVGVVNISVSGFGLVDEITQEVNIAPSGINNVYLEPDQCYVPYCGSKVFQIWMNSSENVDRWQTNVTFGSGVNISNVDFTGGIADALVDWNHSGDYVSMVGYSVFPFVGDHLLANITVDCNCSGGCTSPLNFAGEEDVWMFLSAEENNATGHQVQVFRNVSWENGSVQCVGCGDVDANGYVSANDVMEAYIFSFNPSYLIEFEWSADADGNGYVSANDVMMIYIHSFNPSHSLNCACG